MSPGRAAAGVLMGLAVAACALLCALVAGLGIYVVGWLAARALEVVLGLPLGIGPGL